MRAVPEILKLGGALAIAIIFRNPATYQQTGTALLFMIATFGWPLVFAGVLIWLPRGPVSIALRLAEFPLLGWTAFMIVFANGMDPAPEFKVMILGALAYSIGALWSDVLAWRDFIVQRAREA